MKIELAGLTAHVVESRKSEAGSRTPVCVLMHGFGAPGDDLVALADYIAAPVRFVFPEAPLELGGLYGDSRAWWLLDLDQLERELRAGRGADRRTEVPEGLAHARELVTRLVDHVKARFSVDDAHLALGGFSQGAMLALDVALHLPTPPAAVALMSGTLVAESVWQPRFASLRGVPVFQSHGSSDALLPFHAAELLRDKLREAGASVDWHAFLGGHEIPSMVTDELGRFLSRTFPG